MESASPGAAGRETPCGRPAFDLSVPVRRPPPAVFALLADIQDAEPIPRSAMVRMVKEPAGPTAVGTCWHEWVRVAPGCWLHTESVVSHVQEPYQIGMDFTSLWFSGHLTYEIEPAADGSTLHHRETMRLRAVLRWLSPFVERAMRPRLLERLADIKTILEESP